MTLERTQSLPAGFDGQHRIVVLAPHPDDESLACGTLLAQAFSGAGGHVICMTDGSASHLGSEQWSPVRLARTRKAELTRAIQELGGTANDLTWLGWPDSRLHQVDFAAVAADLDERITALGAQHVFAPSSDDHHADHKATAQIAAHLRTRRPEWSFYSYPVWSRWDDPDFDRAIHGYAPLFLAAAPRKAQKNAAIQAHQSQLGHVIPDDPDGFVMSPAFVEKFVAEDEVFWRTP
ncbi:PIG-L deacetylase family protein [Pseudoruegeria sp. SK021]|uniref:PIG-L deacetylase family protein n=1 Tax=Pseudoruegeria sp. SK021 TaxID=1933035 RepID=UPI000A25226A|nr:PIG-L family deacetylase [Pseudoruegeria sp. SK021]OSP54374.1 hypothetical protein BV911_12900 [Pseudoruegeria sp. SK021]